MSAKYLKILEKGFDNLTGQVGNIEFENGVSVDPIGEADAARLCAAMRCETTDGKNLSIAGKLASEKNVEAKIVDPLPTATEVAKPDETEKSESSQDDEKAIYTREQLEAIADEKGIAGIREIANPLNIKSKGVVDLIEGILKTQEHGK